MDSQGTTPHVPFKCLSVVSSSDTNDGSGRVLHALNKIVGLLKAKHSAAKMHALLRPAKVKECCVYHVINFSKKNR